MFDRCLFVILNIKYHDKKATFHFIFLEPAVLLAPLYIIIIYLCNVRQRHDYKVLFQNSSLINQEIIDKIKFQLNQKSQL